MRVTSVRASRSSADEALEHVAAPTRFDGIDDLIEAARKIRWACIRTVNMFGMAIGDPMTYGTNPSQTPEVFSAPPMVR